MGPVKSCESNILFSGTHSQSSGTWISTNNRVCMEKSMTECVLLAFLKKKKKNETNLEFVSLTKLVFIKQVSGNGSSGRWHGVRTISIRCTPYRLLCDCAKQSTQSICSSIFQWCQFNILESYKLCSSTILFWENLFTNLSYELLSLILIAYNYNLHPIHQPKPMKIIKHVSFKPKDWKFTGVKSYKILS